MAAKNIAERVGHSEPETAFIMGLLHDIGRREGVPGFKQVTDGYHFLWSLGFADAARICLTYSFSFQQIDEFFGV